MSFLFVDGKFQGLDNYGRPVPYGKVEIYNYSDLTLAEIYQDSDLTVPQQNPVYLDENGRADIYLPDGTYKIIFKDSQDNIIWQIDKINISGSSGAGFPVNTISELKDVTPAEGMVVRVLDDLTGGIFKWVTPDNSTADDVIIVASDKDSTGRWHRIYDGFVRPEWFGAKGDGVTDDSNAINNALAYDKIIFDNKTYLLGKGIKKDGDVIIRFNNTTFKLSSSASISDFYDGAVLHFGNVNWNLDVSGLLSADATAGDTSISVNDGSLYSDNDAKYLFLIGADDSYATGYRNGELRKVQNISGNTVTLSEKLTFGYPANTKVNIFQGKQVILLGNFTIDMNNLDGGFIGLKLEGVSKGFVENITVINDKYRAIEVRYSRDVIINGVILSSQYDNTLSDYAGLVILSSINTVALIQGYHAGNDVLISQDNGLQGFVSDASYIKTGGDNVKVTQGSHRSIIELIKHGIIQQRQGEDVSITPTSNWNIEKNLGNISVASLYSNGDITSKTKIDVIGSQNIKGTIKTSTTLDENVHDYNGYFHYYTVIEFGDYSNSTGKKTMKLIAIEDSQYGSKLFFVKSDGSTVAIV